MYRHPSPLPPDPQGTAGGSPLPPRRVVVTVGSPLPPDLDLVVRRKKRQQRADKDDSATAPV
jgi:hypothetical protein